MVNSNDYIARSVELANIGGVPVDGWDLRLIHRWPRIMFQEGTNGIKITAGSEPNTWLVKLA